MDRPSQNNTLNFICEKMYLGLIHHQAFPVVLISTEFNKADSSTMLTTWSSIFKFLQSGNYYGRSSCDSLMKFLLFPLDSDLFLYSDDLLLLLFLFVLCSVFVISDSFLGMHNFINIFQRSLKERYKLF